MPDRVEKTSFNFTIAFSSNPRRICHIDVDGEIYTIELKQHLLKLPLNEFLYAIQRYVDEIKKG